jgi:hypothetical protein
MYQRHQTVESASIYSQLWIVEFVRAEPVGIALERDRDDEEVFEVPVYTFDQAYK